jgi:hypothetical protein
MAGTCVVRYLNQGDPVLLLRRPVSKAGISEVTVFAG